jgi:hypothetical protein
MRALLNQKNWHLVVLNQYIQTFLMLTGQLLHFQRRQMVKVGLSALPMYFIIESKVSLTSAVEGMIGYLRKSYANNFCPPVHGKLLFFVAHYGRQVESTPFPILFQIGLVCMNPVVEP